MTESCVKNSQLPADKSLHIRHVNHLAKSMISDSSGDQIRYKKNVTRIKDDIAHLARDVLNLKNSDLEKIVTKVCEYNGKGAIHEPKFLSGHELKVLRAKLGAIVNSDCWLGHTGQMIYYEGNKDRIKIVMDQFRQLGNMNLRMEPRTDNSSYRIHVPWSIGKTFIRWGFTADDKSVHNERLVKSIRDGPREVWKAYLRELIPEDGSFNEYSGFQWSRSIVLSPGTKDAKYGLEPQLSERHIAVIYDYGRTYEKKNYRHLQIDQDLRWQTAIDSETSREIESIIATNRSRLLDDEADIARKLGIEMRVYPECITLYEDTGRVSIKWVATTQGVENATKWYLLAPPNDVRKKRIVSKWMAKRPNDVERVKKQLEQGGLL